MFLIRAKTISSKFIFSRNPVSCLKYFSSFKTFDEAKNGLNTLGEEPDNTTKLRIYGLFKQATEGPCNKPKPGMLDFVAKAKWEAWNDLKSLSKKDAEDQYIKLINSLFKDVSSENTSISQDSSSNYDGLRVVKDGSASYIFLNRPKKRNAITWEMYDAWARALDDMNKDDNIKTVAISGTGEYFCSGNDLSNFTKGGDMDELINKAKNVLQRFVGAFIDFPKPLIGLINGPAIGISVTTLPLYDMVIASDKATFHTPLPQLGQVPEGCSSYTFPRIMGYSRASDMLLFNKKMSAAEALECGFISKIIPHDDFESTSKLIVSTIAKQPPIATRHSKDLIRFKERSILHKVNEEECAEIAERWKSKECREAIMSFFSKNK